MRKTIYVQLSNRYDWTAKQIAAMTPYQQTVYIEAITEENKIVTVNTIADAQRLLAKHGK